MHELELEWSGLFLFAVGVFGTVQRGTHRHLWLWGKLPLHWFYLALLLVGAALVLGVSPWLRVVGEPGLDFRSRAFRVLRLGVCLLMLGLMAYFSLYR